MKPVTIPRRVDDPPHLLLWSADEILPMMFGLVFGMLIEQALICFLIGMGVTNLYKRYRDDHADGVLLHMLYWIGFTTGRAKSMKNPFVRRYFP